MRKVAYYSAVVMGLYLAFAYGTGSGAVVDKSTAGAANVVRAFEGR